MNQPHPDDKRPDETDPYGTNGLNEEAPYGRGPGWLPPAREPVFNLPGVLMAVLVVLAGIHLLRGLLLGEAENYLLILALAFIPASYGPDAASLPFPLSGLWSPLTYSLLHGNWLHLGMNALWLAAFGTPVARRFGAGRFLLLLAASSAGGALFHYLWHPGAPIPMIGASGAVSGTMGAAARFAFGGPAGRGFNAQGKALGIVESFTNRQFLIFFSVWMALNYLFGAGVLQVAGASETVAWQAHVGGFLTGFLTFSMLERRR